MNLTKFTHSCVRFDDGGPALVIDPGSFSEVDRALDGAEAVLITHEHADHIDVSAVADAARANPELQIWAPPPVVEALAQVATQVSSIEPGLNFTAAGFSVRTFGGQHALIHPQLPVVPNVGYLINDAVYHPGDSLFVPPVLVETLLLPLHAPWSKVSEVVDFAISVRAKTIHNLHDALLSDVGRAGLGTHITNLVGPYGSTYRYLAPGETSEVA